MTTDDPLRPLPPPRLVLATSGLDRRRVSLAFRVHAVTPELLVIFCGLFVLVLCIGAWAAEQIGPDPLRDEDRRHG